MATGYVEMTAPQTLALDSSFSLFFLVLLPSVVYLFSSFLCATLPELNWLTDWLLYKCFHTILHSINLNDLNSLDDYYLTQ